ncbi:hypothetical protein [Agrobacterium sp. CG674]
MQHEETISHQSNGEVFITLLRRAEEGVEWQWFVQVAEGTETIEEECLDEHQARAFYRMICSHNSIKVDYEAPTFAIDLAQEPTTELTAAEVYHNARAALGRLSPGSDAALALTQDWKAEPKFVRLAPEILDLALSGDGWAAASIRTTCRQIAAQAKAEADAGTNRMMEEVAGFGDF